MSPKTLLSPVENKLLLGLFLTVCCVFYIHCADNIIEGYNSEVKFQQVEKQSRANYARTSMFSHCTFGTPISVQIFWLQFFTNPILFFLLRKPKASRFIISIVINSVILFSLSAWNLRNYEGYVLNDAFWLHKTPYGYFGLSSHFTAFILAVLLFVFLILQFSIIVRFVIEKFQAKLSLR